MVTFRVFKVIRPLSSSDVERLRAKHAQQLHDVEPLAELRVGQVGFVPLIPQNYANDRDLKRFIHVELWHYTELGLQRVPGTPLPGGRCRVPLKNIEIGAEYCKTPEVVTDLQLAAPTFHVVPDPVTTDLRTFLESFFASLATAENKSFMEESGVTDRLVDVLGSAGKRAMMARTIVEGMKYCGTWQLLQGGTPTVDEVWDTWRHARSDHRNPEPFRRTNGAFFYIICYRLRSSAGSETAIYTGRSVKLAVRLAQHKGELESPAPLVTHHKIGRKIIAKGGQFRMFPVCFISKGISDYSALWAWTEMALVCLFETFNPYMLKMAPLPGSVNNENPSTPQDTFHKTYSAPLANRALEVTRQIKASTAAFGAFRPRERFVGCNWSVPVLEHVHAESKLWVRTTILGENGEPKLWQFGTHPRRVISGRRINIFGGPLRTIPIKFRPTLSLEEFPMLKVGKMVNVVIEIMANSGEKHQYSYLRIPAVGPFDCWAEASRLGIRLEFLDDEGNWQCRYLTSATMFTPFVSGARGSDISAFGEDVKYAEISWLHCIKVMAALLQWSWHSQAPAAESVWVPYHARVRTFDFDFLQQRYIISDPQKLQKPLPKLLTLEETSDLIEQAFGYDVHIGFFPGKELVWVPGTAMKRTKCDLCLMAGQIREGTTTIAPSFSVAKKCNCRPVGTKAGYDVFQCDFSALMRRYCTFTENVATDLQFHDLVYHHRVVYALFSIGEPPNALQLLETMETEKDDVGVGGGDPVEAIDDEDDDE